MSAAAAPPPARELSSARLSDQRWPEDEFAPVDVLEPASLQNLATLAARAAAAPQAAVFLVDADDQRRGAYHGDPRVAGVPITELPAKVILETGEPIILPAVSEDPRWARLTALTGWYAYAGFPILEESGAAIGVVVAADVVPRLFSAAELSSLAMLAQQAALLAEAARTMHRHAHLRARAAEQQAELILERGRLDAIVSGLHDGLVLEDEDERILLMNQSFVDMIGLPHTPAELRGRDGAANKVASQHLFADPDRFLEVVNGATERRERVIGDELFTIDGRALELDYIPVTIDGIHRGHCWHFRDISARRRAEDEAAFVGNQMKAFEGDQLGASFRMDAEFRIAFATRAATEVFGGRVPFPQVVHDEDRSRVLGHIEGHRTSIAPHHIAYRICPEPGVVRQIEVRTVPLFSGDGVFDGYSGQITDVTAARETEAALARSESLLREQHQRLAMTIAGALDCIVPVDEGGLVQGFNPAAEQTFGLSRAEALGRPFVSLLGLCTKRQERFGLEPTGGERREHVAVHSSGRRFPVEMAVAAVVTEDGVRQTTVFLRDISAAKEAEAEREHRLRVEREARVEAEAAQAELAERNAELARLSQAKDDALAGVSHELRTPLTSMLTFLEMLEEDPSVEDIHRGPLGVVSRNAARLGRIVGDLLDLKDGEVQIHVEPEVLSLSTVAADVVAALEPRALTREVALTASAPGQVVAFADPARTAQVLDVLVDNALKFTPAGGAIELSSWVEDGRAVVTVRDTGRGIAAAELDRVFDRFFQARGGLESGTGSGLGLSIAKLLMDAMGGAIAVESTEGAGTTFRLEFPLVG